MSTLSKGGALAVLWTAVVLEEKTKYSMKKESHNIMCTQCKAQVIAVEYMFFSGALCYMEDTILFFFACLYFW